MLKSPGTVGRVGSGIAGATASVQSGGPVAATQAVYVGLGGAVLKKTADTVSVGLGGAVIGNN